MKNHTESVAEAEDIVQETFLRALEHQSQLVNMSEAQCRSWLYRTAKNILIDRARRKKAEPVLAEPEGREDDLSQAMVAQLCSELKGQEATIFWMRYFAGYSSVEIGRILGMPAGTIRARLLAARNILRKAYPEFKEKKGGNYNG